MNKNKTSASRFSGKLDLIGYFLKGSKRYFAASVLFACLVVVFDMINPKIIQYTVDGVIGNDTSALPSGLARWIAGFGGVETLRAHTVWIAMAVVVLALLAALCRYLFDVTNSLGAEHLVCRMRDQLFSHLLSLPYAWQEKNQTGDLIQRCTSDVDTIKRFLSEQLTGLFRIIAMITASLYFMFGIHRRLALVAAAFVPVIVLYSLLFHDKIGSAFEKVDTEEGKLSTIAQENLTGVRVVRAFGRERYEKDRFETKNEYYTGLWVYLMKLLSAFWAINDAVSGLQVMLVVVLGVYYCVSGSLTAGQYIAFISYNTLITWPVRNLGRMISEMSKAGISTGRILYIMNAVPEQEQEGAGAWPGNGEIRFEDVSFSYGSGEKKVLNHFNLTIPRGATIGILGGTGSGKSTLVHLLDRLYELPPDQGRITIGGIDIRQIRMEELQKHIGLILQEPFLFSRSLEDNIRITDLTAAHESVQQVAEIACLAETIEGFADGYQTFVGERGVTLSGGQKQRTAMAQMLLRRPDIMIFDDSLSAVDASTDRQIRERLKSQMEHATVLLISHRISTLMQADRILVLEHGQAMEWGTHRELLQKKGIYARIYALQNQQKWETDNVRAAGKEGTEK